MIRFICTSYVLFLQMASELHVSSLVQRLGQGRRRLGFRLPLGVHPF
jgi:hypothetical protein